MEVETPPHPPPDDRDQRSQKRRLSPDDGNSMIWDTDFPDLHLANTQQSNMNQSQKTATQTNKATVNPPSAWQGEVSTKEKIERHYYTIPEETGGNLQYPFGNVAPDVDTPWEALSFPTEKWRTWCHDYSGALIVKVLGRSVGFMTLRQKLNSSWKLREDISPVDIGNGFFVVRFWHKEDYDKVLNGGPWNVLGHYVTVQKWRLDFDTEGEGTSLTRVWIRFPGIPLPMYEKECLEAMGEKIGRNVRIDPVTSEMSRGRYARISVEVDLAKPLSPHLWVEGRLFNVEYEGLYTVCFKCGKYGHRLDACPENLPASAESNTNKQNDLETGTNPPQTGAPQKITKKEKKGCGEWMVVPQRTWKKPPPPRDHIKKVNTFVFTGNGSSANVDVRNKGKGKLQDNQSGSRFENLGHEENDELMEKGETSKGPATNDLPKMPRRNRAFKNRAKETTKPNNLNINIEKIPTMGMGRTYQIRNNTIVPTQINQSNPSLPQQSSSNFQQKLTPPVKSPTEMVTGDDTAGRTSLNKPPNITAETRRPTTVHTQISTDLAPNIANLTLEIQSDPVIEVPTDMEVVEKTPGHVNFEGEMVQSSTYGDCGGTDGDMRLSS